MTLIKGAKGGSKKPYQPKIAKDSLHSNPTVKVLIALGEGVLHGQLTGQDIYLNDTPLLNSNGSENFSNITWDFRQGTQDQEYIPGFPGVENDIGIGVELHSDRDWSRRITNTDLSAIRLRFMCPSLQQQHSNGDVTGYTIKFSVELSTDGGAFHEVLQDALSGKVTSQYEKGVRIELPKSTTGWTVRVKRLTHNANSSMIADKMEISSLTEIIDVKLRYPNTALLGIEFKAAEFSNYPQISCEPYGREVRIPTNYNSFTREYIGNWDGSFKWAWSNNPAWVFYDIVLNERFGLGQRLTAAQVDKWSLYQIARYCDQAVQDGRGGEEPRFLCDVYIQSQEDAYTVLRDLASIFRGMTCWSNNQLSAIADMPRDMDYIYTAANVVNGEFNYTGASEKTHYSVALVSWSDPDNNYEDAVEVVSDNDLVRRYGVNKLEISAIGCTRRSEAQRRGRWALLTNARDRAISFAVGLDGQIPLPGYIIGVADPDFAGRNIGGRIKGMDGRNIVLDRTPDAKAGDKLIVNLPGGKTQSRTITAVKGRVVTVSVSFSQNPVGIWSIEADELALQQYRVIGVKDNGDNSYGISAVQHDPSKYDSIDTGVRLDEPPVISLPERFQNPPEDIKISSFFVVEQGLAITTLRAEWEQVKGAVAYEAQWRKTGGDWITVPRTGSTSFEVPGIYAGRYVVRVRAINVMEISSSWGTSAETQLSGKEGLPPGVVNFSTESLVMGIKLHWSFPDFALDTLKTEIEFATSNAGEDAMLLSDIPYPQNNHLMPGLRVGEPFWFRARLVDRTGNQGPWTTWIRGEASSKADDILEYIKDEIMTTETGKELIASVEDANRAAELATEEALEAARASLQAGLSADADSHERRKESGSIKASVKEVYDVVIENDKATATKITQLEAKTEEATATIDEFKQVIADGELATSEALQELRSETEKTTAELSALSKTVAANESATSLYIQQISSRVDDAEGKIIDLRQTVAEENKALAESIKGLTSEVGDVRADVQTASKTVAELDGKLAAQHSIKVAVNKDGKQYAAGMSIGIEDTPSGVQSNVLFVADQFGVMRDVDGKVEMPFSINDEGVFISNAFIADGTITNAKIGEVIQSNNYIPNQEGWRINKNGVAEFIGIKASGEINATKGRFTNVLIDETCKVEGTIDAKNILGDVFYQKVGGIGNRVFVHETVRMTQAVSNNNVWIPILEIDGEEFDRLTDTEILFKLRVSLSGVQGLPFLSAGFNFSIGARHNNSDIQTVYQSPTVQAYCGWSSSSEYMFKRLFLPRCGRGTKHVVYAKQCHVIPVSQYHTLTQTVLFEYKTTDDVYTSVFKYSGETVRPI